MAMIEANGSSGDRQEYQKQLHFSREVAKWAKYGLEYTSDMKGKSLQRELKKQGLSLADQIPDIADDVKSNKRQGGIPTSFCRRLPRNSTSRSRRRTRRK